ncbi:hypothetical protein F895_02601 [Acinetobacter sp. CIP 64.2]|uniref:PP2C family protein-serine/threonine phosphatase n=1 Tax=Acinetobacter sp. CIP 64.2 TaxID=1217694 RepID=UPI000287BCD3|nr:PP2C family serine/threonine-protein phosphatase [Acinetobacter sp. CIP 64.2]ENX13297.1 hypothetical protein F895_02601 [Acinetobacter sp. CIP 64.2]
MLELTNVAAFTHSKSPEKTNEDFILLPSKIEGGYLFGVADGVGSYLGADFASKLAIKIFSKIQSIPNETEIDKILLNIRNKIGELDSINVDFFQAATTLTIGVVEDEGLHIIHVGDCRLYLKKEQKLLSLTKDHTQHQKLLDAGLYTERQLKKMSGKNVLVTALSKNINLEYQYSFHSVKDLVDEQGNILLYVMSDGAHEFWEKRPKFSLNTMNSPTAFSTSLQKRIEKNGPSDDYSLVSVKFKVKL